MPPLHSRVPAPVLFVLGALSMYVGAALAVGLFGRLAPSGVAVLRPHLGPGGSPFGGADSLNAVLGGPGEVQAATRVGVGATYAVTNNLSVGFAVSAVQGRGPLAP